MMIQGMVSQEFATEMKSLVSTQLQQTDYTILLIAGWITCHKRLRSRDRPGEEGVTVDFCRKLNTKYVDFYAKNFDHHTVFVVTADDGPELVQQSVLNVLNYIRHLEGLPCDEFDSSKIVTLAKALETDMLHGLVVELNRF